MSDERTSTQEAQQEVTTRPINLPDELVRAALAGRLTEIRVPVKDAPADTLEVVPSLVAHRGDLWDFRRHLQNPKALRCPLGAAGDRLLIREACLPSYAPSTPAFIYRADDTPLPCGAKWRSSAQMPREACRLWFDVEAIRVERVQSITKEGAKACGAFYTAYPGRECKVSPADDSAPPRVVPLPAAGWSMVPTTSSDECLGSARMAFANWFNRRYAGPNWNLKDEPSPWDKNEWVWVATGRVARSANEAA